MATLDKLTLVAIAAVIASTNSLADGVCKAGKIPLDFVPVAEFSSPQCPDSSSDPFQKNAWEVSAAADGVVTCMLPHFDSIGARTAAMVPCERTESKQCPARLDGLPNAVVLRTPSNCAAKSMPADVRQICAKEVPFWPPGEVEGVRARWFAIGELESKNCPVFDQQAIESPRRIGNSTPTKNAYLVRRPTHDGDWWMPVCAFWANVDSTSEVVVRRFHNPFCPPQTKFDELGVDEGLTGWIVVPLRKFAGSDVEACAWHKARIVITSPSTAPALSKEDFRDRVASAVAERPDLQYLGGIPPTRHSAGCGGAPELKNSYLITINAEGRIVKTR